MKVMKAMKKLKFWSRKKKKKKAFYIDRPPPPPPPPPPPCHCQYQYYYPYEPSAPPLPTSSSSSWVEYDHETQDPIYANSDFISFTSSSQAPAQDPKFAPPHDFNPVPEISPQDPITSAASTTSYQQYMVPNPIYGVPAPVPQVRRERRSGAFGCMFAFGVHLFRCFFPCFHIREVNKK